MKKLLTYLLTVLMIFSISVSAFADETEPTVVAKIGDTEYTSMVTAVNEAAADSTINLVADTTITESLVIDKKLTINFGENTVTAASGVYGIVLNNDANLTLNGTTGGITASKGAIYTAYDKTNPGKKTIVINGGVYSGSCTFNKSSSGSGEKANPLSVTINGGHFLSGITIYRCYYFTANGGTFEGIFSIGAHSTAKTYFKHGLYKSRPTATANKVFVDGVWYKENGYWRLAANTDVCEAVIGSTYYLYLEEALADASNNQTVKVLKNAHVSTPKTVPLRNNLTLDLNGFEVTGNVASLAGTLTVTNGSLDDSCVTSEEYYVIEKNGNTYKGVVPDEYRKAILDGENFLYANDALKYSLNGSTLELFEPITSTKTVNKDETLTIIYNENVARDDSLIETETGYKIEVAEENGKILYKSVPDYTQWDATIGETWYLSIEDAIKALYNTQGNTIKVQKDISSGKYSYMNNASFTLDLNGHYVKLSAYSGSSNKKLTISVDDTSETNGGLLYVSSSNAWYFDDILGGTVITSSEPSSKISEKCYSFQLTEGDYVNKYQIKHKNYLTNTDSDTDFFKTFEEAIEYANTAGEIITITPETEVTLNAPVEITGNVIIDTENSVTGNFEGDLFNVADGASLTIISGTYSQDVSEYLPDDNSKTLAPRLNGTFVIVPASDTIDTDTDGDNFADANNDLDGDGEADVNLKNGTENIDTDYNGIIDEVSVKWTDAENGEYLENEASVEKESGKDIYFSFNVSLDKFEKVMLGENELTVESFEGSTIIKLSSSLIDTLTAGNNEFKVYFKDLDDNAKFVTALLEVTEKPVPPPTPEEPKDDPEEPKDDPEEPKDDPKEPNDEEKDEEPKEDDTKPEDANKPATGDSSNVFLWTFILFFSFSTVMILNCKQKATSK